MEKTICKDTAEAQIKFLGTAGARYVMARQLRYSAGVFLRLGAKKILLDPGPGTLLRCSKVTPRIDATELDAIILSHAHIDHSGDANAMIDAMTCGGWERRGRFYAPRECLEGENRILLNYIKKAPEEVVQLEEKKTYSLDGLQFSTSLRHHHDVETYGLRFHLEGGDLSFITDTLNFDRLAEQYAGSRCLVINVVRQSGHVGRKLKHLSLDEAEGLIGEIRPEYAILTHFGKSIVNKNPDEIAREMTERLGISVEAARDGMQFDLP